jgi:APA family basic amino acid/polyamine antiporter
VPGPWWAQRAVAVAGVLGLAALNYRGVTKTALLTRVLVATSLTALTVVVVGIAVGGHASTANLDGWSAVGAGGAYGILQAAGLLFFAFAGYARIATMGEEVRDPQRTIPRAIPIALLITVAVYLVVGVAALLAAGPDRLAAAVAPLTTAVHAAGAGTLAPVVRIGATLASLGALLALIAGIGRTSLAMARHRDLPSWLSAVHPRYRVPHHAELALAIVVSALAATSSCSRWKWLGAASRWPGANHAQTSPLSTSARTTRRRTRSARRAGLTSAMTTWPHIGRCSFGVLLKERLSDDAVGSGRPR